MADGRATIAAAGLVNVSAIVALRTFVKRRPASFVIFMGYNFLATSIGVVRRLLWFPDAVVHGKISEEPVYLIRAEVAG